ncbi:MAG: Glutathione S-transferase, partial [uncultured Sphingomonadaceae bacterium]
RSTATNARAGACSRCSTAISPTTSISPATIRSRTSPTGRGSTRTNGRGSRSMASTTCNAGSPRSPRGRRWRRAGRSRPARTRPRPWPARRRCSL